MFYVSTLDVVRTVELDLVTTAAGEVSFVTRSPIASTATKGRIISQADTQDYADVAISLATSEPTPCKENIALSCCLVRPNVADGHSTSIIRSRDSVTLKYRQTSWVGWGSTPSCKDLI